MPYSLLRPEINDACFAAIASIMVALPGAYG
jgi:hypothetical protein